MAIAMAVNFGTSTDAIAKALASFQRDKKTIFLSDKTEI
jgi:hypothetical protein